MIFYSFFCRKNKKCFLKCCMKILYKLYLSRKIFTLLESSGAYVAFDYFHYDG